LDAYYLKSVVENNLIHVGLPKNVGGLLKFIDILPAEFSNKY